MDEADHNARFAGFTSLRIADVLVDDEKGFGGLVRKRPPLTDGMYVNVTMLGVVRLYRPEAAVGGFVTSDNRAIAIEGSDLRRIPSDGTGVEGREFYPDRRPALL